MTPSELCELNDIQDPKARYFRYVDTKQWSRFRSLFTDDAVFEGTSVFPDGPDDFVEKTSARLRSAVSIHQGHMPEIRLIDADNARGIWAMYDHVTFAKPATDGPFAGHWGFTGYGYYQEAYRKIDGHWKISFLRLTRLSLVPLTDETATFALPAGLLAATENGWLD